MENEFWKTILAEWAQKEFPDIYPRETEIDTGGFDPLKYSY